MEPSLPISASTPPSAPAVLPDLDYDNLLLAVRERFHLALHMAGAGSSGDGGGPLFTTGADNDGLVDQNGARGTLYVLFLSRLPVAEQGYHACRTCRRFIETYGGLVIIDASGRTHPVLWGAPESIRPLAGDVGHYAAAVKTLHRVVSAARVTGVYLSPEAAWGHARTGAWPHMAVDVPKPARFTETPLVSAYQAMASKREDHGTLARALADFSPAVVDQAVTLLSSETLYRSEKVLGVARWLQDLHIARSGVRMNAHKDNLAWLAVATAPPGFAHVRSTMIGTLLEDLAGGLSFEDVSRKFASKMHPLQYQRPTAPPSAGNIAQAEKVVATLRSAGALERRFSRVEELETIWTPRPPVARKGARKTPGTTEGVFAHLAPPPVTPPLATPTPGTPPTTVTFEKFCRTVLPDAASIAYQVEPVRAYYCATTCAVHPEAPALLQWDREQDAEGNPVKRNTHSQYVYHGGNLPADWNLSFGWCPVTAVSLAPWMWPGCPPSDHHGKGVLFVLAGCRDMTHRAGGGMFVEQMRSEYHGVRATLEAYIKSAPIAGSEEASACGIRFSSGATGVRWVNRFRVTSTSGAVVVYHLDRWD